MWSTEGSKEVVDLRVECRPVSALQGIADGSLRLVDMPGQDETDNPVVKEPFCVPLCLYILYIYITS